MKVTVAAPSPNEFVIYLPGPQGPKGELGSAWLTGSGVPAGVTGRVFDFYLNATSGDYYEKTADSTWTLRGNIKGVKGDTGTMALGTIATGAAGTSVVITNTGTPSAGIFNFTIPRGDKGNTGTSSVGTTTTGAPGTSASVSNTGTPEAGIFNFTIPRGDKGATGTLSLGTVATGAAGSSVVITNTGTPEAGIFNFTIPRGDKGNTGTLSLGTVATGAAGSSASITNTGTPEAGIFNFTIPKGDKGTVWLSGPGVPTGPTGVVGDWYLNQSNSDVYEKTFSSTWTLRSNIKGATGTLTLGTVTTGAPGDPAQITNTGTPTDGIFNFVIPKGDTGPMGPAGSTVEPVFTSDDVSGIPLTAMGFAGQTASLQAWKNSAGTTLSWVSANGSATFAESLRVSSTGSSTITIEADTDNVTETDLATLRFVQDGGATNSRIGLSSTNNFEIFSESSSSILTLGTNNTGRQVIEDDGRVGFPTSLAATKVSVFTNAVAMVGIAVRGAVSQTADLQQWQDNAGTALARVYSSGTVATVNRILAGDTVGLSPAIPAQLGVNNTQGATVPTAIFRSFAGQTADIAQFQDNVGNVLARIGNDGTIYKGTDSVTYDSELYNTEILGYMGVY